MNALDLSFLEQRTLNRPTDDLVDSVACTEDLKHVTFALPAVDDVRYVASNVYICTQVA